MPKRFELADEDVLEIMQTLVNKHHPDLTAAEVQMLVLMVHAPTDDAGVVCGDGLTYHGHAAAGKCSLVTARDRVKIKCDARIELDGDRWPKLSVESQHALLDHELHHIVVVRDGNGRIKEHDDGRPKLRLRKDDWCLTGFVEIAKRHGFDALEVQSFKRLWDENGQCLFPWAIGSPESRRRAV